MNANMTRQGLVFHTKPHQPKCALRTSELVQHAKNFIGFAQHFAACRALIWINGTGFPSSYTTRAVDIFE